MADALCLQGFGVALLTLCLFVGGKQKKETIITISTRKKNEHSMPSSSRVHRTETHTVFRVQPHPFANLAQVQLFPAVSQSTLLIMDSFVAAVDEAPTTPEVQEAVVAALVGAGFTNPEHLIGTADSVIGELAGWLAGPAGGLLKRTFRCAEDVSEAKRTRAVAMASSSQSGHLVSQVPRTLAAGSLLSLLGPEASAGAVASALTAGKHSG